MAIAIGLLAAACSDPAARRCEDGSYCPEGTRCGRGAFCLVEEASCGDFGANAPCVGAGDAGARFCAPGGCRDGVRISGRVTIAGGGPIQGAAVTALDREWMQQVQTDELGGFAIDAVQNDSELVLRVEGDDVRRPVLTRRLALGTGDYQLNGDATAALRVGTRENMRDYVLVKLEREPDPSRGAVAVHIGRAPGSGVRGATATLAGPTEQTPLYFNDGQPDVTADRTSEREPTALFLELEPGTYTVTGARGVASTCVAAGDDRPDPIVVDVRAGELTNAGWIICR